MIIEDRSDRSARLMARRIRFINDELYFKGKKLLLTATELKIIKILLEYPGYITAEALAEHCVKNKNTAQISVHICDINAKSLKLCGERLVYTRRFSGYRILK